MKKKLRLILLFALLIFSTINSNSQTKNNATKDETESWILQKLKSNTPYTYFESEYFGSGSKNGSSFSGFKYSFDEFYLTIKFDEERTKDNQYYDDGLIKRGKTIRSHTVKIPIFDILNVVEWEGRLIISTSKNTISNFVFPGDDNAYSDFVSSSFMVKFNFSQTDLAKRLKTAFLHLKKFYKKPKSEEIF